MKIDSTLENAPLGLTGFEIIAIEQKYGKAFEELGGVRTILGLVYSYAARNKDTAMSWAAVQSMTLDELQGCFATAEDHDREEAAGKGE